VLRWSPDSRQLATIANDGGSPDPWLVDVATGTTRQLVDWGGWEGDVEFSADGTSVYIVSDHESSFNDIWRIPLDSTPPERVTRTGTPVGAPWPVAGRLVLPVFGGTAGRISLGEILPTGTVRTIWDRSSIQNSALDVANLGDSIIVSGTDDDGSARSRMIALADGGARLLGDIDDRVSGMARAGRWVVFSTGGQRGSRLGVLHLDTGERRLLTDGLTDAGGAEYLADSTVIAYRRSVRERKPVVVDVTTVVEPR
jgi:dipeptidyl aminopeptidase/acylaminoacyl peptidase